MRFATLSEWLAWQEQLHPSEIDLGLERVAKVYHRLIPHQSRHKVITVGGTNGKGSSVAMLQATLQAAGFQIGCYTSPHIVKYNERITLNGVEVDDQTLCQAFERVDQARGEISLSYFEFGTLAALDIFNQHDLDAVVLEVGLGGRLDAVNIVDADVALITNVDLDHQAWLGNDREAIGFEKAGIMRAGRPAVFGDSRPPQSLLRHAEAIGAELYCLEGDYQYQVHSSGWRWSSSNGSREALPMPAMRGDYQLQNAAGVLMALECLKDQLPVSQADVRNGLLSAKVAGRFQIISSPIRQIFDVAHNPHAVEQLKANLEAMQPLGRSRAVFAMMADKEIAQVIEIIKPQIDQWYIGGLSIPRAASTDQLVGLLNEQGITELQKLPTIADAYHQALSDSGPADQIIVFGSFYTIAAVMAAMQERQDKHDEEQAWKIIASSNV